MPSEPETPEEIAYDLLSRATEIQMFQRTIRRQGHSRYIAISKLLPKHFGSARIYKIADHRNAALLLFIDPSLEGFNAQITRDRDRGE